MTVVKDFVSGLANQWLQENIRSGFGKPLKGEVLFVARVLAVEGGLDPDPSEPQAGVDPIKFPYQVRCRILSMANKAKGATWDDKDNPDAGMPDPCNLTAPDATASILRHPWYEPLNDKLKKPYVGDIIKVSRRMGTAGDTGLVGTYMGFIIATPLMKLPPPKAGRGGFGDTQRVRKKPYDPKYNPPVQYTGAKLHKLVKDAAYAINNRGNLTTGAITRRKPKLTETDPVTGETVHRAAVNLDPRLRTWEPVDSSKLTGHMAIDNGIPDLWFNKARHEYKQIERFILWFSDGYPGMPNEKARLYLYNSDRANKDNQLKKAPPPNEFATNHKLWLLWWTGIAGRRLQAPLNGDYRALLESGWTKSEPLRFGFGAFGVGDAGTKGQPGNLASNLYFPTAKGNLKNGQIKIKYAGTAGIGDPLCEMYALLMFIKLNFGSPWQFAQMIEQGEKILKGKFSDLTKCERDKKKCKLGHGGARRPRQIGTYSVDYAIMPKTSPYACGMCEGFPPTMKKVRGR